MPHPSLDLISSCSALHNHADYYIPYWYSNLDAQSTAPPDVYLQDVYPAVMALFDE